MPTVVNIDSEKIDSEALICSIMKTDSQVVLVKGVLDVYDETLFTRLCELCPSKYLFFSISNLENLKMMSKAVTSMAIIIDAEDYLHFEVDENILIGDHDITPLVPEISIKACQDTMKKVFNRLISNQLIGKATALKYCQVIRAYFELMDTNTMGQVMQKAMVAACSIDDIDDNTRDILVKSGITIFNE